VSGLLLDRGRSRLLLVDAQERLAPAIDGFTALEAACGRLLAGAALLAVPVTVSEQYPAGLGPTVARLKAAAGDAPVFAKTAFSCLGDAALRAELLGGQRDHLVLCRVETHVCVLQTGLDLLAAGRAVYVVADAVGSRTPANKAAGLDRLAQAGAQIITSEMALFEWLGDASDPAFRAVSKLVR
jgi:hypothetical protein